MTTELVDPLLLLPKKDAEEFEFRLAAMNGPRHPVLLLGESGCGKSLLARHIHRKKSGIADDGFFQLNCASMLGSDLNLTLSKLFGHEPHAFTDAGRHGRKGVLGMATEKRGTVFLDEIHHLSVVGQAQLLTVFDQGAEYHRMGGEELKPMKCGANIVLATNRDPLELLKEGRLMPDFFFRIRDWILPLKPLRECPEALRAALRSQWRNTYRDRLKDRPIRNRISPDLCRYPALEEVFLRARFPGNFRDLEHACAAAMFLLARKTKLSTASPGITRGEAEAIIRDMDAVTPPESPVRAPGKSIQAGAEIFRKLAAMLEAGKLTKEQAAERLGFGHNRQILCRFAREARAILAEPAHPFLRELGEEDLDRLRTFFRSRKEP